MEKNEMIRILTAVKNTLEGLDIKATASNCDKMLGSQQAITRVIKELEEEKEEKEESECSE